MYLDIPPTQDGVEGGFVPEYNIAAAYAKASSELYFKNMVSYLKINLSGAPQPIVSVKLTSKAGEPLTGPVAVGLFEEPTIEPRPNTSNTVQLAGEDLNGVYYFVVMPQTLSKGYELVFTDINDMRATVDVPAAFTANRNQVADLGTYGGELDWKVSVNPNPTQIENLGIFKMRLAETDFNIMSEPGFEEFTDEDVHNRTLWKIHEATYAIAGHTGQVATRLNNDVPGWWMDVNTQVVALHKNKEYSYRAYAQATTPHVYNGMRLSGGNSGTEVVGAWWAPNPDWVEQILDFNSGNNFWGVIFAGIWGDAGVYFVTDDFRLYPKGSTEKGTMPAGVTREGNFTNTTYDELGGLGKAIVFEGPDGKYCIVMHDVTVAGVHYDNLFTLADDADLKNGASLSQFVKDRGKMNVIWPVKAGEQSIIPTGGITVGGKIYLLYNSVQSFNGSDDWVTNYTGLLISEDNGRTWTDIFGGALTNERFGNANFARGNDGYIYVLSTNRGRKAKNGFGDPDGHHYISRFKEDSDVRNLANWSFWNGETWIVGNPNAVENLTVGSSSESSMFFNPKTGRYMMIYWSNITNSMVYRDAAVPEGDWSGEKILFTFEDYGKNVAPSIMEVDEEGNVWFVATKQN